VQQQFQGPQVTAHYVPFAQLPADQSAIVGARDGCGWEIFLPIIDASVPPERVEQIEQQVGRMLTETFGMGLEACAEVVAERMLAGAGPTARATARAQS
jgi:hypothetical protein